MTTIRKDGSTISSGVAPADSIGTVHAGGGGDIPSGFGSTSSGTVHGGGPDITSGMHGPYPAVAAISLNIGDSIVINSITYQYHGVISKSTGEAEIFLLTHNEQKCVFKLYYPNFKPKEDILKKLKQLKHDDIINVHDYGYYHDRFFEVMDYAEGGTLDKYLPIKNLARIKQIISETVNAYKFCHANRIIHKDIKPQNLYYKNSNGTDIVIGDFGISSALETGMSRHLTSQSLTVGYAAPEMYGVGGKVYIGKEVDYYALGITLIHIWEGKSPFDGLSIHAISNLTTCGKVCIPEDMPKELQKLVKGLITVDYTKRWGSEEIQRWMQGEDVPLHFHIVEINYPPYQFSANEAAATAEELASVLKNFPEKGKKHLYSRKLSAWVNLFNQGLAVELDRIIEDDYPKDQDAGIQKAIYILNPDEAFVQNGKEYRTAEELANALEEDFSHYMTALANPNNSFYLYLEAHEAQKEADIFRKYFKTFSAKKALNTIILELNGRESINLGGELFFTPDELLKNYKDRQMLVNELKDTESKLSLWIEGSNFDEIKKQVEQWRKLRQCDEITLAYVGSGVPQLDVNKTSFDFNDLRIGNSFSDSFTISNNGDGILSGSIISNKPWLRISKNDIDKKLKTQNVSFDVNTSGLSFGFKETGTVEIKSNVGVENVDINVSIEDVDKALPRFRRILIPICLVFGGIVGFMLSVSVKLGEDNIIPIITFITTSILAGIAATRFEYRRKGALTKVNLFGLLAGGWLFGRWSQPWWGNALLNLFGVFILVPIGLAILLALFPVLFSHDYSDYLAIITLAALTYGSIGEIFSKPLHKAIWHKNKLVPISVSISFLILPVLMIASGYFLYKQITPKTAIMNQAKSSLSGKSPKKSSKQAASTEGAVEQETKSAVVVIKSTPTGATVFIDKKQVGTTPLALDLKSGSHGLAIEKAGYKSSYEIIDISNSMIQKGGEFNFALKEESQSDGKVEFVKEQVARGASIYKTKCAACHGANGQGTAMAPAFKGSTFINSSSDGEITEVITDGRDGSAKKYKQFAISMPKQKYLNNDEVKAVVVYIKALAAK